MSATLSLSRFVFCAIASYGLTTLVYFSFAVMGLYIPVARALFYILQAAALVYSLRMPMVHVIRGLFHGRLKRFLKADGEMISLPALEDPFTRLYPPTDAGPRVAVDGIDAPDGGRRVVLFTTEEITLREANAVLHREGFRGVMRLDEVRKVEMLPLLGTGKMDYRALRAMIIAEVY